MGGVVFSRPFGNNWTMTNFFIKTAIRANFKLTGRERINGRIRRYSTHYLELAKRIDGAQGAKPVLVPRMVGVDEDMRTWSFFMVLEHNTIVGRMMTSLIERLARGETPEGDLEIKKASDLHPMPAVNRSKPSGLAVKTISWSFRT